MSAIDDVMAECSRTAAWFCRRDEQNGVPFRQRLLARRQMNHAARAFAAHLEELAAHDRNDIVGAEASIAEILSNPRFKYLSASRVLHRGRRGKHRGRNGQRVPQGYYDDDGVWHTGVPRRCELREIAERANHLVPQYPVNQRTIRKPNGELRHTFSFSLGSKALQQICADITAVWAPQNEFDFSARNRGGIHEAARQIQNAICERGLRCAVVCDVRNAFPSVTAGHVRELVPFPVDVVDNVICPPAEIPSYIGRATHPTSSTDLCMPQGAISSLPIWSALLGRELQHLVEENRVIVVIVDDITILSRTRDDAEQALSELEQRLSSLRHGPLSIGSAEICEPQTYPYIQMAGYANRDFDDGQNHLIRPANKSYARLKAKIAERVQGMSRRDAYRAAYAYFQTWCRGFPAWSDNSRSHTQALHAVREAVERQLSRDAAAGA